MHTVRSEINRMPLLSAARPDHRGTTGEEQGRDPAARRSVPEFAGNNPATAPRSAVAPLRRAGQIRCVSPYGYIA